MARDPKTGRFVRADAQPVLHRQLENMDGLPIPEAWEEAPADTIQHQHPSATVERRARWAVYVASFVVIVAVVIALGAAALTLIEGGL